MSASDWYQRKLGNKQASPHPQPQSYPQPVQQVGAPVVNGRQTVLDPARPPDAQLTMGEAVGLWRGGQGNKDVQFCPSCHGKNYYSRGNLEGGGLRFGPPPSPHCFDCGYPVVQFGSATGAGNG